MKALYVAKYVSPRERPLTLEEAHVREVSYGLKRPTDWALTAAALPMARALEANLELLPVKPQGCWLVPVPNSRGSVEANLQLAREIALLVPGARVKIMVQRSRPVPSSCERRKAGQRGLKAKEHNMIRACPPVQALPVYFVDNVVTTGETLKACAMALGWGVGLVYADASSRRNNRHE